MIETGLVSLLNGTASLSSCDGRIYPEPMPDNPDYPAITYSIIAARPEPTLRTSGYQRYRVEFRCRDKVALNASTLREALREALEGYNGVLTDGTFLQDAQFIQLMDSYLDNPRVYVRTIEMYLFFCFPS